jgi:hypothetical protein
MDPPSGPAINGVANADSTVAAEEAAQPSTAPSVDAADGVAGSGPSAPGKPKPMIKRKTPQQAARLDAQYKGVILCLVPH